MIEQVGKGRRKNLVCLGEDRTHDRDDISAMGEMVETQNPFQLLQTHNCCSSSHEPHYGCMRQKIDHKP